MVWKPLPFLFCHYKKRYHLRTIECYSLISFRYSNSKLKVTFVSKMKDAFITTFRPLDISIIIDNMISNAKKANARNLSINLEVINGVLQFIFIDDGKGLSDEISEKDQIFKKGFSTTKSTGLGLYHISNIITENNWNIDYKVLNKGLQFTITITK